MSCTPHLHQQWKSKTTFTGWTHSITSKLKFYYSLKKRGLTQSQTVFKAEQITAFNTGTVV